MASKAFAIPESMSQAGGAVTVSFRVFVVAADGSRKTDGHVAVPCGFSDRYDDLQAAVAEQIVTLAGDPEVDVVFIW